MPDNSEPLLRAILSVTARQAFPPEKLADIVLSKGAGAKQLRAFNLCDGSRSQGDVAKTLDIDSGNFSKTVGRWMDAGIVIRLGDGRDAKLLHLYPLPDGGSSGGDGKPKGKGKTKRKQRKGGRR